ncbi:MAG: class B sortase [Ruminococcaceae bacterium]|nr:class B sortase [Oscillospiraceae bacterium]
MQKRPELPVKQTKKISRKKKNNLPDFNSLVRAVAFVIMFCSLAVLSNYASGYIEDIELNQSIVDEFGIEFKPSDDKTTDDTGREVPKYPIEDTENDSGEQRFTYPVLSSIDSIKSLSETYGDFVFWLYIDGTSISYPVVQAADNEYYLRKNINGKTNLSGTVFLDYRNMPDMSYGNNIVYGHNMQNGTMFGTLKKYSTKSYYDKHRMIYTYTDTEVTAWKIFSVYETTTDNYYIQTGFVNDDNYLEFIKGLQKSSMYAADTELTSDDVILTLSTCHKYDYDNGRLVVHAEKVFTSAIA